MTPRHNDINKPLCSSGESRQIALFLGEPAAFTSNLAVRTGLSSTPFAARKIASGTANYCYVARQFTRRTLRGWDLHGICDDTVQIASELVANAIRHGQARTEHSAPPHTEVWLALALRPRTLLCVVRDPGQRRPLMTTPPLTDEHNRGLPIVDALSDTWGWSADTHATGKSVWARVPLRGPHA